MKPALLKVLLIEDNESDGALVAHKLRQCATVTRFDNREGVEKALEEPWDVALVDLHLWGIPGSEAIRMIKDRQPELPVIIVTGSVDPQEADAACEFGAVRFFMKDYGLDGLDRAVRQAKEVRDLKAQSVKTQRLELLGDLAAGIVHDMNGVLQIFTMGIEALRTRINPMDEKILDLMDGASKRGGEMTAQILKFARGSNGTTFKSVTPQYLIGEVGAIMRRTFPPNIRTTVEAQIGTMSVRCDSTQIIQVLQNLANNARDAMPDGGELKVRAQNITQTDVLLGPCVMFSVSDTGDGIPPDSLERVWEPFFTTKPHGQGTGLGLPTVKRIIENHHGAITVESESGRGTTFRFYLPMAAPWISANPDPEGIGSAIDGSGRIVLLVDDDRTIRELTQLILEGANYRVLPAANGVEALNYFRTAQQPDVLLTDLSMPIMDGVELVQALRAQGFGVPVVLLSGYDSPEIVGGTPGCQVLRKPISRETLLAALHKALDSPAPSA